MLSQAASGPGRLPGLSGGPARKLGTELSFVEATGAPQKAVGGSRLGVREPPTPGCNVAQAGGSQRPGHRLGGRVASLRPGVARSAGLRRQGEGVPPNVDACLPLGVRVCSIQSPEGHSHGHRLPASSSPALPKEEPTEASAPSSWAPSSPPLPAPFPRAPRSLT